jgi:hypothetical protein
MKFLITENKLDGIIDSFITKQFEDLKPIKEGNLVVWVDPDKKPYVLIKHYDNGDYDINILESIYFLISNMFSIKELEDVEKYLLKWFEKHTGMIADVVFAFDNDITYEEIISIYIKGA